MAPISFNPRTHTGCDIQAQRITVRLATVSIHAPTRGATRSIGAKGRIQRVSIHAPTRGATLLSGGLFTQAIVSIHAPTRGATTSPKNNGPPCDCFNPRTHTGCDTSPKDNGPPCDCFNPRTHTGCDAQMEFYIELTKVSIHAPTRGATTTVPIYQGNNIVSIHAPTRGATFYHSIRVQLLYRFQSTHPHGVRQPCRILIGVIKCFNPRTHTGCDLTTLCFHPDPVYRFNPRTHTGCDSVQSYIL